MTNFSHRNLPHWVPLGGEFFITACLKNAIPKHKILSLKEKAKAALLSLKKNPSHYSKEEKQLIFKRYFRDYDVLLDTATTGEHYLAKPAIAQIILDKIKEYDGVHYDLIAVCIMSNHFHILIDTSIQLARLPAGVLPTDENHVSYSQFMQLIKGGSAYSINQKLGRRGTFWQKESYDHLVRNAQERANIIRYIAQNPVKAKIATDWKAFPFTYIHPDWVLFVA